MSNKTRTARPALEVLEGRLAPATDVLTYHNDNMRTGQNPNETVLTPAILPGGGQNLGTLFTYGVDDQVFAQPLYVAGVTIGGGMHNVVIVATEHDSVYAIDADSGVPYWQASLGNPIPADDVHDVGITPYLGITGTPVIARTATGAATLCVMAGTKEVRSDGNHYVYRLHKLDVSTGTDVTPFRPAADTLYNGGQGHGQYVDGSQVPGIGGGTDGVDVDFFTTRELQRPALALVNGLIYVGWADFPAAVPNDDYNTRDGTYHGWLEAYSSQTLQRVATFNTTPNDIISSGFPEHGGGIWMTGGGPAADSEGNLFFPDGDGDFNPDYTLPNLGDSVLRISPTTPPLTVSDYFTPYNQDYLHMSDLDLGSGGVLVLPDQAGAHQHELVQAGKQGTIYVIDRDDMGGYQQGSNMMDRVVQEVHGGDPEWAFGTFAYFNAGSAGQYVYFAGNGDHLKAWQLTNGLLSMSPTSQSAATFDYPGATPSVSANSAVTGPTGLVWVVNNPADVGAEMLYAYDATDLTRDPYVTTLGQRGAGFSPPATISNGKVYVADGKELTVLGLLSHPGGPDPARAGLPGVASALVGGARPAPVGGTVPEGQASGPTSRAGLTPPAGTNPPTLILDELFSAMAGRQGPAPEGTHPPVSRGASTPPDISSDALVEVLGRLDGYRPVERL
jgi:hypothetical protein